jgi:general nucleoside transport system ATP-binding protein
LRGEIVGIAGVEGNGQTELLEALLHPAEHKQRPFREPLAGGKLCRLQAAFRSAFGSPPSGGSNVRYERGFGLTGRVEILGHDVTAWPAQRIRDLGVAVVPEDRLRDGLLPERPLTENMLLGLQRSVSSSAAGWLNWRRLRATATRALQTYDVRATDLDAAANTLSGGNQQKLIVAREFERQPQLLLAAQPTRGVDVGAIEFIHQQIVAARDRGAGVLLVSSELEEILALSDRILVMYEGRFVAEFHRGQVTEQQLGLKMGGG